MQREAQQRGKFFLCEGRVYGRRRSVGEQSGEPCADCAFADTRTMSSAAPTQSLSKRDTPSPNTCTSFDSRPSSQQNQPYTTHSLILPVSVTSNNVVAVSNAPPPSTSSGSVSSSGPGPGPLPAQVQVQQRGNPQFTFAPAAPIPPLSVQQGQQPSATAPSMRLMSFPHQNAPLVFANPPVTTTAATPFPAAAAALVLGSRVMIPMTTSETPKSIEPSTLRSGKWFPEEEEYALLLIRFFEQGLIGDCEDGTTLRSYLAKKLHCAPMRISKKFAGRGIGKRTYTARGRCLGTLQQLQQSEHKFQQAILASNPLAFPHGSLLTAATAPTRSFPSNATAVPVR